MSRSSLKAASHSNGFLYQSQGLPVDEVRIHDRLGIFYSHYVFTRGITAVRNRVTLLESH